MGYLVLEVICFVVFCSMLKVSETYGGNRLLVALFNYSIALVTAVVIWFFTKPGFDTNTVLCGILGGFTWVAGLLIMMPAMKIIGVAITSTATKMAVAIPIAVSILFWNETPALYQGIGIALAFLSMGYLSYFSANKGPKIDWKGILLILGVWLLCGGAHFSMKLFQQTCEPSQKPSFLIVLFSTAIFITLIGSIKSAKKPKLKDLFLGIGVGVSNALTGFFLICALQILPAMVVFPVAAVSGMVILAILGVAIWKEKLSRRAILGILVSIVAVILITVKFG